MCTLTGHNSDSGPLLKVGPVLKTSLFFLSLYFAMAVPQRELTDNTLLTFPQLDGSLHLGEAAASQSTTSPPLPLAKPLLLKLDFFRKSNSTEYFFDAQDL